MDASLPDEISPFACHQLLFNQQIFQVFRLLVFQEFLKDYFEVFRYAIVVFSVMKKECLGFKKRITI